MQAGISFLRQELRVTRTAAEPLRKQRARRSNFERPAGVERPREVLVGNFLLDLRYALRRIGRDRGFTAVVILTLAVALGANSAIFSVINAVLLRPLSFGDPESLVQITSIGQGGEGLETALPNMNDIGAQVPAVESVGAYSRSGMFLMEGEAELVYGCDLQASTLQLLRTPPLHGRLFTAQEDVLNGPRVLLISERLWRRRFGADPSIVGRALRFGSDGDSWRVIGVMPATFDFPLGQSDIDYFAPLMHDLGKRLDTGRRDLVALRTVGRLRRGQSVETANAQLATLARRLERAYPASNTGVSFRFTTLRESAVKSVRPILLMLMGAVGVVLLIGCANVANLLMARATTRRKEIAIRAAIGAGRASIVRQLLVESTLLAVTAGLAGLALAAVILRGLVSLAPQETPRLAGVRLDGTVVLFTLAVSLITGIAFGLAPALRASRGNLSGTLREGTRGTGAGGRNRTRNVFVAAAVALSLVLLAGAGLLIRSFAGVLSIDPGFDHRGVATLQLSPRKTVYAEEAQLASFHQQFLREIASIPGVTAAGGANALPLSGWENVFNFDIGGRAPFPVGRAPVVRMNSVLPGYFETMKIRILRGRAIDARDTAASRPVMIISEAFARRYFPNEDPIGKTILMESRGPMEIIGVAGDIRLLELTEDVQPMVYNAGLQTGARMVTFVARGGDSALLARAMREALRRLDPQQAVIGAGSLEELRTESLAARRFSLLLLVLLAAIALVLAAAGIYSIMSFTVAQRTAEIGVRMAVGAGSGDIFRLVVGQALRLVGAGAGIGLVAALGATTFLRSMLYKVGPADPLTFTAISAALGAVALLASWIPARRASRLDPVIAIRE